MSKVSYKPYYTAKERREQETKNEVKAIDILAGACAGLTVGRIVKGMSQAFCEKQGVVTKIGTAVLGIYAAISFGVKGGSMFYHVRSGMTKAYREITKEEEKDSFEEKDGEVKWDPAPDISEAELRIQYEHPEEWLCFSSHMEASKIFAFCIKSIASFGYVSVADVKKEMNKDQILNYIDNVYGWSNLEDDFGIKREPDGRYSITHVKPYPIDISEEDVDNGESET